MKTPDSTIFLLIESEAERLRTDAGYGGRSDDGGAANLLQQARFYKYGRDGIFPPEWSQFKRQAELEVDPDYAVYMGLRKRFEGY